MALVDPLAPLTPEVEPIERDLVLLQEKWAEKKKGITLKEKRLALSQLEALDEKISGLQPPGL